MKSKEELFKILVKQNNDYGKKGLLPQNLPDELVKKLLIEFEAIQDEKMDVPASMLFLTILMLKGEVDMFNVPKASLSIAPEELMDSFSNYGVAIVIEDARRQGKMSITKDSIPTLENIFDSKRSISFEP